MGPFGPRVDMTAEVHRLLLNGKFDVLEGMAVAFNQTQVHLQGGDPAIAAFYRSFTSPDDAMYKLFFHQLGKWETVYPNSSTVHLATARLWNEYARYARESGNADAEILFDARDTNAATEFAKVDPHVNDPFRYGMLYKIVRDTTGDDARLEQIYHAEIAAYPTYWSAYLVRLQSVGPEYGGTMQSELDFANGLLTSPGGEDGKIAYMAVGMDILEHFVDKDLIGPDKLAWETLKVGMALSEQRYGFGAFDWEALSRFATMANDKATAKAALARADNTYDKKFWGNIDRFNDARAWMNQP